MMAHLCMDYPDDPNAHNCNDQYMLGRKLLVAPIVEKEVSGREVFFPAGKLRHYFTQEMIHGGKKQYINCPVTEALVFEKVGD